jgi:hypothetical protein
MLEFFFTFICCLAKFGEIILWMINHNWGSAFSLWAISHQNVKRSDFECFHSPEVREKKQKLTPDTCRRMIKDL